MGFPCSLIKLQDTRLSTPFDNTRLLFPRWFCSLPSPLVLPNTWINGAFWISFSLSLSFIFRCSFHFVILTQPLREGGCNEARLYIRGQIRAWRMRRFTWTVWNASMQECLDFSPPGNKGRARGCSDELRARGKRKRHGRFIHVNVPSAAMLDLFFTACSVTLNVMPRLSCIW